MAPRYTTGAERLLIDGWVKFRDATFGDLKKPPANTRSAFFAGFDAGVIVRERLSAQLKRFDTLQARNIKLEADNIELRKEVHYLRTSLTDIKKIVDRKVS